MSMPEGELAIDEVLERAKGLLNKKEFAKAQQLFTLLRELQPGNAYFADALAACKSSLELWSEAQQAWLEAISSHGPNISRVNALALSHIELGQFQAAQDTLLHYEELVSVNANYYVFATIASFGSGAHDLAIRSGARVEELAEQERISAFDYLCGLFGELARRGHGDAAPQFFRQLIPVIRSKAKLARTAIYISFLLQDFEAMEYFSSELIMAEPDSVDGYMEKLDALIATGQFEEFHNILAVVKMRFAEATRQVAINERIRTLEEQASSRAVWKRTLDQHPASQSFQSLCFRVAAYMTLRKFSQAIEAAEAGSRIFPDHPWFDFLIGRAELARGNLENALNRTFAAVQKAPGQRNFALQLCHVQWKAGLLQDARRTLAAALLRHPKMPAVSFLAGQLELPSTDFPDDEPMQRRDGGAWLHGGDAGDLIYALPAMQAYGGGHLFLTCVEATREPMTANKLMFLEPLLSSQSYIDKVSLWHGENITHDFTAARHRMPRDINLTRQQWLSVIDGIEPDIETPWLTVPHVEKHRRPVFARSARYRNSRWDQFWQDLKIASPDAIFVGTKTEYSDFGHGEHYLAENALDLARTIAGASIFVGNQSLPYAIAEGLKTARLLEVSPQFPNCIFSGALPLVFNRDV
jgi:tetratricopeptide (TPR) repeat protein